MERFLKVDSYLLAATTLLALDGTEVSINLSVKILHMQLLDRFLFFKSVGQEYYDTNIYLANKLGVEVKTVERGIKVLERLGLVKRKKIRIDNLPKNVYIDVKPFNKELIPKQVRSNLKQADPDSYPENFDYDVDPAYNIDYNDPNLPF